MATNQLKCLSLESATLLRVGLFLLIEANERQGLLNVKEYNQVTVDYLVNQLSYIIEQLEKE